MPGASVSTKPIAHRRKHKNSKLGCAQCKQRRVKCDEGLPSCQKCIIRDTRCGYLDYSPEELAVIEKAHKDNELFHVPVTSVFETLQPNDGRLTYPPSVPDGYYPLHAYQTMPVTNQNFIIHMNSPTLSMNSQESYHRNDMYGSVSNNSSIASSFNEACSTPTYNKSLVFDRPSRHSLQHYLNKSATVESNPTSPSSTLSESPISTTSQKKGTMTMLSLIPHRVTRPEFNPKIHKEYFDETVSGVNARIYLTAENAERFEVATYNKGLFDVLILTGYGRMVTYVPSLLPYFLLRRGETMRLLISALDKMTDENTRTLLNMSSALTRTAIHMKKLSIKDHQMLSSGPSAIIQKALESPELFPSSLAALQRYADGYVFVLRCVYYPSYTPEVLKEFLEVVEEFGIKYIKNEDNFNSDDPLVKSLNELTEYIKFIIKFTKEEKSDKHVLRYPVKRLYEMLQRWYDIYPSMAFTINSRMPGIEKVLYNIWHSLSFVLESIFFGCRYIFTYLFNGYYDIFTMPRDIVLKGLDDDLRYYANYFCRIMAYLVRRKQYIVRNTVLDDPFPTYANDEDRFKLRPLDIKEYCITEFKKTVIKPYHYPSEETIARSTFKTENYYKGSSNDTAEEYSMIDKFSQLNPGNGNIEEKIDLLNVDPNTALLTNDFDPRFTDPIFEGVLNFPSCDASFLTKYTVDRKMIMQLDDK